MQEDIPPFIQQTLYFDQESILAPLVMLRLVFLNSDFSRNWSLLLVWRLK